MRTTRFFLILILLYGFSVEIQSDQCTFNSTIPELPSPWSYSTLDQVRQCFENISINKSTINETIKQLFNSLDFYSFLSLVRQSNDPYNMNVNLHEELLNIVHQSNMNIYKTDYDFHISILSSFKKLKDFHTKYFLPNGYAQFHILLPFILEYLPLTKQIKIKYRINLYSSITNNNLTKNYINRILTKIDGINVLDYLKEFAQLNSIISKDPIVRLNSVLREEFWLRNLAEYELPIKNNITFTFDNENVTFPYVIIILKNFHDQIDIENDNQFSLSSIYPTRIAFDYIIQFEKLNWYEEDKSNSFDFIMGNNTTYYYIHKPTNISIIKLESFDEKYADDIKKIFSSTHGETLIIDVIGNHGGASCLAYGLLNYLVPEYSSLKLLYEPLDGRTTDLLYSFAKVFSLYPNSILDLRNFSSFTNMEWIEPYVNYTRGNSTDEYSMKWSINCDGAVFGSGAYWIKRENNTKYFKSIYILTDGTCGSACSLFVSKLKYGSNFKMIYGIGGESDKNLFESSSYAGGGAFNWNDIVKYSQKDINYLPTSAYLNLNVFEIYINQLNKDYPREFLKQPIDRNLNTGDYFNIDQSLQKIIDYHMQSSGKTIMDLRSSVLIYLFSAVYSGYFRVF